MEGRGLGRGALWSPSCFPDKFLNQIGWVRSTMVLMGAVHFCRMYPPGCPAPRLQKSGPRTTGSTVIHSSIFWATEQGMEGLFDPKVQV